MCVRKDYNFARLSLHWNSFYNPFFKIINLNFSEQDFFISSQIIHCALGDCSLANGMHIGYCAQRSYKYCGTLMNLGKTHKKKWHGPWVGSGG